MGEALEKNNTIPLGDSIKELVRCVECDEEFEPANEFNNICSQECYLSYHGVEIGE